MKVAIVGSRDYRNLQAVRDYVDRLPEGSIVVSGGARGVDKTAEMAAKARSLQTIVLPAVWDGPLGKRAGFARNVDIVAAADMVVAFWDCESRGTAHSIALALAMKKPVALFSKYGQSVSAPAVPS